MVAVISDPINNERFIDSNPYTMDQEYVELLITKYHVRGIIFLGSGTKEQQKKLTAHFQSMSTIPLLIGLDAEWGSAMRLKDGLRFPKNNMLGIFNSYAASYLTGYCTGKELQELGVRINFATVVDVHTNPLNPIINKRSFGDNPHLVTNNAYGYICGLHNAGILSCIKHFPGHGDTAVDSHYDLPIVLHDRTRLESVELYPFKKLLNHTNAVMTGHLSVPAFDATNTPASLSYAITTQLLQNELGFSGLIITDGLGMQAVAQRYAPGELELAALIAGNDILLCLVNVEAAIQAIKNALMEDKISIADIDKQVSKIICAKSWANGYRA